MEGRKNRFTSLERVYLAIGDSIIEISCDKKTVRLSAIVVAEVATRPSEPESGLLPCVSSIGTYLLTNPYADNRIARIVVYDEENGSFGALEIILECGQILFFDPMFFDGINFGGIEQKEIWLANVASYDSNTIS